MSTQLPGLQIRRREKLFTFGNEFGEHALVLAVLGICQLGRWRTAVLFQQLRIVGIGSI